MSNYAEQIRNAGLTETYHDNWVDEQERKLKDMRQGTITWHEIAKGELPPVDYGQWVLVSNVQWIDFSKYNHEAKEWIEGEGGRNWQPTHWAFINKPQTT